MKVYNAVLGAIIRGERRADIQEDAAGWIIERVQSFWAKGIFQLLRIVVLKLFLGEFTLNQDDGDEILAITAATVDIATIGHLIQKDRFRRQRTFEELLLEGVFYDPEADPKNKND